MASSWSGLLNDGRSLPVSACCFNVLPALLLLRVLDVFVGPLGHFATPRSNFVNNRSCLSPRLHLTSRFAVLGLQREMHEQLLYVFVLLWIGPEGPTFHDLADPIRSGGQW